MPPIASYPSLVLHLHRGRTNALETEWLSFVSSAAFRSQITDALELARRHNVTGWIANDRLLGAVRPVDLRWVAEVVLPAMAKLGVQRFARLESEETLNRMLIGNMYQDVTEAVPFEVRSFGDLAEARAWACGLTST
ncbi:hypothetical protein [Solirubrum puertoriconensis]|uniref:STAS/SEC14 domain-containing protein n=1 Tax=Solirubrum puertoriconensis TaxID=1751427 RepID=A0A9X0L4Y2_SOLP1|nr:hypothetical protein [Solirubrum puertoriconensis]KUG08117.1 hypothetical protein ASU33_07930 [Solirubrum puertoriconensis]